MRHAAGLLVLCYAVIVTAGPVAHTADRSPPPVSAVEDQHGAACVAGHDPATCPLAGLSRAPALTHRPSAVPEPRELSPLTRPDGLQIHPKPARGPNRSTGPPAPALR